MSTCGYHEDQPVEQPAIRLLAVRGWAVSGPPLAATIGGMRHCFHPCIGFTRVLDLNQI